VAFPDTLLSNQWGSDTDPPSFIAPSTMNARVDAWLNALATRVNANQVGASVVVPFTTGTSNDTTSATMVDWVAFGNVTVPSWATRARIAMSLDYFLITATTNSVVARVKLGTATGVTFKMPEPSAINVRVCNVQFDLLSAVPTGSQALVMQAQRLTGTGSYRSDANSWHSASIDFLP